MGGWVSWVVLVGGEVVGRGGLPEEDGFAWGRGPTSAVGLRSARLNLEEGI